MKRDTAISLIFSALFAVLTAFIGREWVLSQMEENPIGLVALCLFAFALGFLCRTAFAGPLDEWSRRPLFVGLTHEQRAMRRRLKRAGVITNPTNWEIEQLRALEAKGVAERRCTYNTGVTEWRLKR